MDYLSWQSAFVETTRELVQRVTAFIPNLLGAAVLLLLGWLLARLSRVSIRKLIGLALGRLSKTLAIGNALDKTGLSHTIPSLTGAIAYWIIVAFFAAAAIEQLELAVATNLVSQLAFYLPRVLLGLLLVFAAVLAGNIAHNAISRAAASAGFTQGALLGRAAEVVIVLIGLVIGAGQAGIESTLFTVVIAAFVGSIVGAAALAFALGARPMVGNMIGSHYLSKMYSVGQTVRIAGFEGRILEFNQTGVLLESVEGRVLVPARKFSQEASILVNPEA